MECSRKKQAMKCLAFSLVLCLIIGCISGCGKQAKKEHRDKYLVETKIGVLPKLGRVLCYREDDDGIQWILATKTKEDQELLLLKSSDQGASFEETDSVPLQAVTEKKEKDAVIQTGDIRADGAIVIEAVLADGEGNTKKRTVTCSDQSGTVSSIALKKEQCVVSVRFAKEQNALYINDGAEVSCYDEKGEKTGSYQAKNVMDYVELQDDLVLLCEDGLHIFSNGDTEERSRNKFRDTSLEEDLKKTREAVTGIQSYTGSILKPGKDDNLYYMLQSGVYEQKVDGSMILKLAGGKKTQFQDPSYQMIDYVARSEQDIRVLVLYHDEYSIYAYTKEAKTPVETAGKTSQTTTEQAEGSTVDEDGNWTWYLKDYETKEQPRTDEKAKGTLVVYSLKEDFHIDDMINIYQKYHPNVTVERQIGMEEGKGTSIKDAVAALNTSLMSGASPDVLFLDGLDVEKYEKNGMLASLNSVKKQIQAQEPFENIITVYEKEQTLYAIPSAFQPSLIIGKKQVTEKIHSLKSLYEYVKESSCQTRNALCVPEWDQLHNILFIGMEPAILQKGGQYDRKQMKEYITYLKKISDKLTEQRAANPKDDTFENSAELMLDGYNLSLNLRGLYDRNRSGQELAVGRIHYDTELFYVPDIARRQGDTVYQPLSFGCGNTFEPAYIAAVSDTSANKKLAMNFVSELFAPYEQCIEGSLAVGIPVTKEGLRVRCAVGAGSSSGEIDGQKMQFYNWFGTKKEYEQFLAYIAEFDTPVTQNIEWEQLVDKEITSYMKGSQDLEKTCDALEQKMKLMESE